MQRNLLVVLTDMSYQHSFTSALEIMQATEKHAIEKLLPFLDCLGLTANYALHLKFHSLKKQNAGYDFLKNNNKNILIFLKVEESKRIGHTLKS